ncbi:hypothetical protein AKJ16_DCAP22244 [Drosera capensis]
MAEKKNTWHWVEDYINRGQYPIPGKWIKSSLADEVDHHHHDVHWRASAGIGASCLSFWTLVD